MQLSLLDVLLIKRGGQVPRVELRVAYLASHDEPRAVPLPATLQSRFPTAFNSREIIRESATKKFLYQRSDH